MVLRRILEGVPSKTLAILTTKNRTQDQTTHSSYAENMEEQQKQNCITPKMPLDG
jgi:hypothetical protein